MPQVQSIGFFLPPVGAYAVIAMIGVCPPAV